MILLVVPKSHRGAYGSGHWKDIASLQSLLREVGDLEVLFPDDGTDIAAAAGQADALVWYYTFWPERLRDLRRARPRLPIHVRTVNAEALQHWCRAEVTLAPTFRNLRTVYGFLRLAARDSQCRREARTMLGISPWDNRHYWAWLPGRATLLDVPYVSPWPQLRQQVQPLAWEARRNAIVCLSGARDAIGRTNVNAFCRLAESFDRSACLPGWQFSVSAGLLRSAEPDTLPPQVTRIDDLAEPWDLLCAVKGVAVMGGLGYGFKTTVVDGLAAGCHVLVDPRTAAHLPECVRAACLVVDLVSPGVAASVAAALQSAPPRQRVNEDLHALALQSLRMALC